jgi:hypothetical protein
MHVVNKEITGYEFLIKKNSFLILLMLPSVNSSTLSMALYLVETLSEAYNRDNQLGGLTSRPSI